MNKRLLKTTEAAAYIGETRHTIYKLVQNRELVPIKITEHSRPKFLIEDLDALIERKRGER